MRVLRATHTTALESDLPSPLHAGLKGVGEGRSCFGRKTCHGTRGEIIEVMRVAFTTSLNEKEFAGWREIKREHREVRGSGEEPSLFQKAGCPPSAGRPVLSPQLKSQGCPTPRTLEFTVAGQMDRGARNGERM